MDYLPLTTFNAHTLASHVVYGFSSRHVESVMVDGVWRLWKRKPLALEPTQVNFGLPENSPFSLGAHGEGCAGAQRRVGD